MEAIVGGSERSATPLARFACVECGYGASRALVPERCPMCGGTAWEHEPWRPFTMSGRADADQATSA
jgi:rubrerythrin